MHCSLIVLFLARSDDPFLLVGKSDNSHAQNGPGFSAEMQHSLKIIFFEVVHFNSSSVIVSYNQIFSVFGSCELKVISPGLHTFKRSGLVCGLIIAI